MVALGINIVESKTRVLNQTNENKSKYVGANNGDHLPCPLPQLLSSS
jgi:hypothetical protein